ncbi:MAG: type II secretion system minor pseudopilin GspJ [Xanthomonadales bacterium]|nr:type II secretion system minor pseudopilin GspJ [Xanthomonadales bacterium]
MRRSLASTGPDRRMPGFTLIELLVALAVFAAMAAIAQAALNAVLATRTALDQRGREVDAVARTLAMMERDLRGVVARPVRIDRDARLPALVGGQGGLELSTLGRGGAGDASAARLERIAYRAAQGRVERLRWPAPDRADGTRPDQATMMEGVLALRVRFLAVDGRWHDQWPPAGLGATATTLPRAAEITLEHARLGRLLRLVELPEPAP